MSRRYLFTLLLSFLLLSACSQLEGTGSGNTLADEDTTPPNAFLLVGESYGGPYLGDESSPIESAFDSRVLRVEPGETFYIKVGGEDLEGSGITELTVELANDNPEGLSGPLDPTQSFFTLSQVTGISEPALECDLSNAPSVAVCFFEIRVAEDAINIDELAGSEDEFAYIFRTQTTDAAGNTSEGGTQGYVIIGGDTVEVPDAVLESVLRDELGKPAGDLTIADLRRLTSLQYNGGEGQRIESLEGLQFATNLTELSLPDNRVEDFSPLRSVPIQSINVADNSLSDLSSLRNVAADFGGSTVTYVQFNVNEVSDLSPLTSFPNLRTVLFGRNQITSLAPLEGLTQLSSLEVQDNQVDDLSPLVNNPGIGEGDFIILDSNPLDVCPGTEDRADINALIERGADILFDRLIGLEPEDCS